MSKEIQEYMDNTTIEGLYTLSQKKQTNTIMKFVKQLKQWKKLV